MHIEIHAEKTGGYVVRMCHRNLTAQLSNKDKCTNEMKVATVTDVLRWLMNAGWMNQLHVKDIIQPEDS